MRSISPFPYALVLLAACAGAKLDKSAAQYSEVRAMATTELGGLLDSEASRSELNRAGLRTIQRAVESLGRKV